MEGPGFRTSRVGLVLFTHRPHSSSFLGVPYRILNMNPQKELLWGLWVRDSFPPAGMLAVESPLGAGD